MRDWAVKTGLIVGAAAIFLVVATSALAWTILIVYTLLQMMGYVP